MNKRMVKKAEREKKRRVRAEYNSMKEYCAESEFVFAAFGCVAFALLRLYMLYIEIVDGGSILLMAEAIGCILLALSVVFCSMFSRMERMPKGFTKLALFGIIAACSAFCALDVMELINEREILGLIQTASMVIYCAGCVVACGALLWAGADKKISPAIGSIPAAACVAAMIFLTVRGLAVFSSLLSAIGPSYSWEAASDLSSHLSWALRSVSRSGGYAVSMFYARMIERVALLFAVFSTMPLLFKFKPFFEKGNRELDFKREFAPIRMARIEKAVATDEDFDYMPKITSNRHRRSEPEDQYGYISFEEDEPLEKEEPVRRWDVPPPKKEEEKAKFSATRSVEREIPLNENETYTFAKPESVTFEKSKAQLQKQVPKRTDKPDYSNPEDPDFWNHYLS